MTLKYFEFIFEASQNWSQHAIATGHHTINGWLTLD
jgi:hypothetical protein